MTRLEFRVRWRREGLPARSTIFQTEQGARAKADRLERLEDEPTDEDWEFFGGGLPPALIERPTIEVRNVGEWRPR